MRGGASENVLFAAAAVDKSAQTKAAIKVYCTY